MMTEAIGELKFRVEFIIIEAKAPSRKYKPLGFGLQLASGIIYGTGWSHSTWGNSPKPKYQPLGLWLQLVKYKIINGVSWPLGCYNGFAWTFISGEEIFINNIYIYDQGCWIIKAWVKLVVLEVIAQTPKYQPLGLASTCKILNYKWGGMAARLLSWVCLDMYLGWWNIHEQKIPFMTKVAGLFKLGLKSKYLRQ